MSASTVYEWFDSYFSKPSAKELVRFINKLYAFVNNIESPTGPRLFGAFDLRSFTKDLDTFRSENGLSGPPFDDPTSTCPRGDHDFQLQVSVSGYRISHNSTIALSEFKGRPFNIVVPSEVFDRILGFESKVNILLEMNS